MWAYSSWGEMSELFAGAQSAGGNPVYQLSEFRFHERAVGYLLHPILPVYIQGGAWWDLL